MAGGAHAGKAFFVDDELGAGFFGLDNHPDGKDDPSKCPQNGILVVRFDDDFSDRERVFRGNFAAEPPILRDGQLYGFEVKKICLIVREIRAFCLQEDERVGRDHVYLVTVWGKNGIGF